MFDDKVCRTYLCSDYGLSYLPIKNDMTEIICRTVYEDYSTIPISYSMQRDAINDIPRFLLERHMCSILIQSLSRK